MSLSQHYLQLLLARRNHPHQHVLADLDTSFGRPPCSDWLCAEHPTYTCSACYKYEIKQIRAAYRALALAATPRPSNTRTEASDSARSITSATSARSQWLIEFKTPSGNHLSHQASRSASINVNEPTISSWLQRPTPSASITRATPSNRQQSTPSAVRKPSPPTC